MASLTKVFITLSALFTACSGVEQAEQEKIKRQNAHGEIISRRQEERLYQIHPPQLRVQEKYPWEKKITGRHARITKEFFRCKGSSLNPMRLGDETITDCRGREEHSLPIKENSEFIYPILLDLLNYIQAETGKKVVITCGHRCPTHNRYADESTQNRTSKHMIGAEVDFYVQGMEDKPQEVIELLIRYYLENPFYSQKKEYTTFQRFEDFDTGVSTPPWFNKEVLFKLVRKTEGRDFDNRHPYPYVTIQVRYDRLREERVNYSWPKAYKGYLRY